MKKSLTTRKIRTHKAIESGKKLSMLTCYDFQTAQALSKTNLDLILVGDSLGNVILGFEDTLKVTTTHMEIFTAAVKRGAPDKFVVCDVPFGAITTFEQSVSTLVNLFKNSNANSLKIEGASDIHLKVIQQLVELGVPVMGHIGLRPQSVHEQGGYYTHGKSQLSKEKLLTEAISLQNAGCFSIVLECVERTLTASITDALSIPTIGIGSGDEVDGQVLVLNDLLGMGEGQPSFATPIESFHSRVISSVETYIGSIQKHISLNKREIDVTDGPYA